NLARFGQAPFEGSMFTKHKLLISSRWIPALTFRFCISPNRIHKAATPIEYPYRQHCRENLTALPPPLNKKLNLVQCESNFRYGNRSVTTKKSYRGLILLIHAKLGNLLQDYHSNSG
ncbi:hypothetical protein L9F63_007316, partial [Diploptera punctata]